MSVLILMMELRVPPPDWSALTKADPSLPVWLGQVRWKLASISVWLITLYAVSHPPDHMLYITSTENNPLTLHQTGAEALGIVNEIFSISYFISTGPLYPRLCECWLDLKFSPGTWIFVNILSSQNRSDWTPRCDQNTPARMKRKGGFQLDKIIQIYTRASTACI